MNQILRKNKIKLQSGVATLPTVMALVLLILAAGIGIAAISLNESFIVEGQNLSSKAFFYAESGAKDALMRIARDKNYSASSYQIAFFTGGCSTNEGCATISVSSATSPKVIVSEGRANANIRRIQVDVYFDAGLNGEIQNVNWRELTD